MKKIFAFVLALVALFALVACGSTNDPVEKPDENKPGEQGDKYTPGITVDSNVIELKVGDKLEPLQGVHAIDAQGNDLLSQVEVSHVIPLDENGCVKQSGEYKIKYVLTINGEKYNLYRDVKVIFELPQTDDLIVNGDFELGATDPFTKSEFDNGGATLSVVKNGENHELKVDVTAVSWQLVSPRVETNAFALTAGKYYKLTFKARADVARSIQIQVGQLLSEAPWFYGLAELNVDLTTTMQEFELVFKADDTIASDLTKIQALFGFGTQPEGKESAVTACYLDDIKVEETKVASLLTAKSLRSDLGGEEDAQKNPGVATVWYDQGAWCGAATEATFTMENEVIKISGTQPAGSCWFATQLFLYSETLQPGNYTLSFKLKLDKAGNIKYGADSAQNVALKAIASAPVAAGDNELSVTFNILEASQAGLSLQFGTEADGNIGAFNAEVSEILLVRNGDAVVVDYADANNILGTIKGSKIGGQGDAEADPYTFYVWYVQDAGWGCGPVCTVEQSYADGALTVKSNLTNEHWWFATQVFYATEALEATGTHKVSFKLNASAAGTITINGKKVDLVAGDNNVEFDVEIKSGAKFLLSIQLGWEEVIDGADNVSHQYLGNNTLVLSEFKMDGVAAKTGEATLDDVNMIGAAMDPAPAGITVDYELSLAKTAAGDWEWIGLKASDVDFTGYTKMVATIKGAAGEKFLFKVNDQGSGEKWVDTTGEVQEVEFDLPAGFAWDANKVAIILFANAGGAGTSNEFLITKLEIQGADKDTVNLLAQELVIGSAVYNVARHLVLTKATTNTNEWDCVLIGKGLDLTGYAAVKYTVQGTNGEKVLIKTNDNGAVEKFITLDGTLQSGVIDLSTITYDTSKAAMVIFPNPQAAGTGNKIIISELVFVGEKPAE